MSSEAKGRDTGGDDQGSQVFVQDYLDLLLAAEAGTGENPPDAEQAEIPEDHSQGDNSCASTEFLVLAPQTETVQAVVVPASGNESGSAEDSPRPPANNQATAATAVETIETRSLAPIEQWLNGRPPWAQARFECLLFEVSGLTLALPRTQLAGIYPIEAGSIEEGDSLSWSLGRMVVKGRSISVIDTANLVMPERYDPAMQTMFKYVIAVRGMDWGLAADRIDGRHIQEVDGVQWCSELTTRRWLAGTIINRRCALVEVNQMNKVFRQ